MAEIIYTLSLFSHILSVFLWLSTIPILFVIDQVIKNFAESTSTKLKLVKFSSINAKIAIIAAFFVFFTGSLMIVSGPWSWSPTAGTYWLVTKQIIWFVLIVGTLALVRPLDRRIHDLIDQNASEEKIYSQFKKFKMYNHMFNGLVVVNILLATVKPF